MLTPEIIATREATLSAHLDGETNKDVDMVLDTFADQPQYDLVPAGIVITGREEVGKFLQTFYDSMGPNEHLADALYHTDEASVVEVKTIFPGGFSGEDDYLEIFSVGVFLFDGDRLLCEKLYADVSPLLPFMPWLTESA